MSSCEACKTRSDDNDVDGVLGGWKNMTRDLASRHRQNGFDFEEPRWDCQLLSRDKGNSRPVSSKESHDRASMLAVCRVVVDDEDAKLRNVFDSCVCGNDDSPQVVEGKMDLRDIVGRD